MYMCVYIFYIKAIFVDAGGNRRQIEVLGHWWGQVDTEEIGIEILYF